MGNPKILTADTRSDNGADPVTGTSYGAKRGLDVFNVGPGSISELVRLALVGFQPEPNYNSITMFSDTEGTVDYIFRLSGEEQFTVRITNADTALPTATVIVAVNNLLLEDGDFILLENGDQLLLE